MSDEVASYIEGFGGETTIRLKHLQAIVKELVPDAIESISYGLVGYKRNGKPLVYFGAFPKHIGFYATPNGHEAFKEEFSKYKQGKGSVQFPLEQPLPIALAKKVILYRKQQTE